MAGHATSKIFRVEDLGHSDPIRIDFFYSTLIQRYVRSRGSHESQSGKVTMGKVPEPLFFLFWRWLCCHVCVCAKTSCLREVGPVVERRASLHAGGAFSKSSNDAMHRVLAFIVRPQLH